MKLGNLLKGVCEMANRHSPEILTGLGIAGFVTAIVLAVKATPAAEDLIVQAEDEKEDTLTPIETAKAAWKVYIPSGIAALGAAGCLIGAAKINHTRNTELATACAISQAMAKRWQEKTAEIAGEDKAKEIDDAVKKETVQSTAAQTSVSKLPPSNVAGVHPFWDPLSNTAFYASTQMLERAEVALNKRLYTGTEPYVTIDDLYDELNEQGVYPPLKHTSLSNMMGWTAENGGIEFDMDIDGIPFEQHHWDDGTPCYLMSFKRRRQPEYVR